MNISFKRLIILYFSGFLFLSIVFLFALANLVPQITTNIITFIVYFILMYFVLAVFFMMSIRGKMKKVLSMLSLTIQSIVDDKDNVVFSDVEDNMLSKLQSQIIKLSKILKANNNKIKQEKDNITSLISDISHQLKNPLANLNMYNSLLLENYSVDKDKQIKFLHNMQSQINKLNWLIQSLIKMSRLETDIIQLNPKLQKIEDTILTAIKSVYPKAENKNIEIALKCDNKLKLNHDEKWTAEAIFNIIDNAVKYTNTGGKINVAVSKYELFARIDVTDNGSGIKQHEINNIFKRFYRGENARNINGVGIGLYLVREIISKQGGYIKVKSEKNKGSIFSIFLPM